MADLTSILAGTDDPYQTPEEVALRRKRGMQLFNEGTSVAPVQHWTQALGRGLQGALGGYELGQARDQEQQGKAAANSALAGILSGTGDPTKQIAAGLSNPYGAQMFGPMAGSLVQSRLPSGQLGQQLTQSEIAKNTALANQANADNVQVNNVTGEYYNRKGPLPGQASQTDQRSAIFRKKFAETEAPKGYVEASKLYGDASDTHSIYSALEQLAPYAKTGFGAEQVKQLRKLGSDFFGIKNPTIAPTELFQFLSQKGVFELTKQLKPASNLDMIASEKATASIQSDPSTLPIALPVLKTIAQRSMLQRQLEMQFYKEGMPPDTPEIAKIVNERVPLDISGVLGMNGAGVNGASQQQVSTPSTPTRLSRQNADAEYQALQSGQQYYDPDGNLRTRR